MLQSVNLVIHAFRMSSVRVCVSNDIICIYLFVLKSVRIDASCIDFSVRIVKVQFKTSVPYFQYYTCKSSVLNTTCVSINSSLHILARS